MSTFRKVTFRPYEEEEVEDEQHGGSVDLPQPPPLRLRGEMPEKMEVETQTKRKGNLIRERALERQRRMLKIIMKLAAVKGYNDLDHIRLEDGSYMRGSDLVPLLMHALSPGRIVVGLSEFVQLLHYANVEPELIVNETVRSMLEKLSGTRPRGPLSSPPRLVPREIPMDTRVQATLAGKRKRNDDNEEDGEEEDAEEARARKRRALDAEGVKERMTAAKSVDWDAVDSDLDGVE
ncbi:hypothetical protein HDE_07692 [Halotydeus destructor]|nr:hypothetical protein HDE_07692 [Halotydeus destructor]